MNYRLLTETQLAQIVQRRLLDLEAEHARLDLDVRLAKATGVDNDNVTAAVNQLELLVEQIAVLVSWSMPRPVDDVVEASSNGSGGS